MFPLFFLFGAEVLDARKKWFLKTKINWMSRWYGKQKNLIFKNKLKLVDQKNQVFKNNLLLIGKYLLDKSLKIWYNIQKRLLFQKNLIFKNQLLLVEKFTLDKLRKIWYNIKKKTSLPRKFNF